MRCPMPEKSPCMHCACMHALIHPTCRLFRWKIPRLFFFFVIVVVIITLFTPWTENRDPSFWGGGALQPGTVGLEFQTPARPSQTPAPKEEERRVRDLCCIRNSIHCVPSPFVGATVRHQDSLDGDLTRDSEV